MAKNGGTLQKLFNTENPSIYEKELLQVTNYVDRNSKFEILLLHKDKIKNQIKRIRKNNQKEIPKISTIKKVQRIRQVYKNSKAKYLLKYDRIKLVSGIFI